jgi:hypothetical protein
MTVDELVKLTEALVGETSVREAFIDWDSLAEDDLVLLVRFIGGERPEAGPTLREAFEGAREAARNVTAPRREYRDPGPMPDDFETDDEEFVRPPQRQDPDKPLVLKGSFDGVELP